MKFSKGRLGSIFVMSAMLLVAAMPVDAATMKFGAKFTGGFDPDNGNQLCDHEIDGGSSTYACTWIIAHNLNGTFSTPPVAPANGKITKVKLVSGNSGSLKVVLARKNASGQFKVVAISAKVSYHDSCPGTCTVQTYTLATPLTVHTGDYLGAQGSRMGPLRCNNGSPNTALFTPVLPVGGSFETPDDFSGCYLELQAVYGS